MFKLIKLGQLNKKKATPNTAGVVEAKFDLPLYVLASQEAVDKKLQELNAAEKKTGIQIFNSESGKLILAKDGSIEVLSDDKARAETDAFIKTLAVIALKRRKTKVAELMPAYTGKYLPKAMEFVKRHGVDKKAFTTMAEKSSVLKGEKEFNGSTLSERANGFLKNFRAIYRNKIKADMDSISRSQYQILNALITLISTPDSDNAYKSVSKYVTYLNDSAITPFFTLSHEDTGGEASSLLKQRMALIKKMGGNGNVLTSEIREKANAKNPQLVKDYNKLSGNILARYRHDVRKVLLDSSKDWDFLENVTPKLKKMGWPEDHLTRYYSAVLLGSKKTIGLNQNAELTNKHGESLGVTALGIDTGKVIINTKYEKGKKPEDVFKVQSAKQVSEGKGESRKYYTLEYDARRKGKKWDKVARLIDANNIEKAKAAWRKYMTTGKEPASTYANLNELLYWTAGRIGSKEGSSEGKRTWGISSLEGAHVTVMGPTKVKIQYPAKSNQFQTHILDGGAVGSAATPADKKAFANLLHYMIKAKKQSSKDGLIFSANGTRVNSLKLAAWTRNVIKMPDYNNHMMRYLRGTQIAQITLADAAKKVKALSNKGKLSQKDANEIFTQAIQPVAKQLGHFLNEKANVNTSIKSYISPTLMMDWYKQAGVLAPTNVRSAFDSMNKTSSK